MDADALAYFLLDGYMVGRVEQRPAGLSGEEQAELLAPGPGQLTRARVALAQQGDLTLDESVG